MPENRTTGKSYSKTDRKRSSKLSVERADASTKGESVAESATPYKPKLVWTHVFYIVGVQIGGIYGLYLMLTQTKLLTILWVLFLTPLSKLGTTMGAHRYYTHRTFKTNKWMELLLVALYSTFPQRTIWRWVLDHRQHHKYSDTDADPHNSKRGFFYSHIGWTIYDQHPEVLRTKRTIDLSDIEHNPIVLFHKKYYYWIFVVMAIIFPTIVPYYFWHENLYTSLFVCFFLRFTYVVQCVASVNSFAHMYGMRPFNGDINPSDNKFVSMFAFGEGWHNYHHTFPWDYRASQYGQNWNVTTTVIDYCAKKGWVYDLKEASAELVEKYRVNRGERSRIR